VIKSNSVKNLILILWVELYFLPMQQPLISLILIFRRRNDVFKEWLEIVEDDGDRIGVKMREELIRVIEVSFNMREISRTEKSEEVHLLIKLTLVKYQHHPQTHCFVSKYHSFKRLILFLTNYYIISSLFKTLQLYHSDYILSKSVNLFVTKD
jgi:hypothetical protein